MLTPDEKDYLSKIPTDKTVHIFPYDPQVEKIAEALTQSVKNIYPNLGVKHMGASALGISGQNDIDIYAFSNPKNFYKYTPGLIKLFGKPKNKHETFYEWKFEKDGFDIEFYLTEKDSITMKKQIKVFEILRKDKSLLREYEQLKESMNGKSFKKYQEKKYRFYHRIIDKNF
ncbi:MAG: GrpB family protein [Patescibacteria group bacterium]